MCNLHAIKCRQIREDRTVDKKKIENTLTQSPWHHNAQYLLLKVMVEHSTAVFTFNSDCFGEGSLLAAEG